jgi:hypothetical protein
MVRRVETRAAAGPDWSDMRSVLRRRASQWTITGRSAAMVLILVTAFVLGSWLQIALAPQPVDTHIPTTHRLAEQLDLL